MAHRAKPSKQACPYVSKGGLKLAFALQHFAVRPTALVAADLGSHQGGFVDCLLQHGAAKVYSVDTCYGTLAWTLRQNPRVVVCERTNALHWRPPQEVRFVTIDLGWTRQELILSKILNDWQFSGTILSLLKPQYELGFQKTRQGVLSQEQVSQVVQKSVGWLKPQFTQVGWVQSPYLGSGGNTEYWLYLTK